jgi:hypothetical protein
VRPALPSIVTPNVRRRRSRADAGDVDGAARAA